MKKLWNVRKVTKTREVRTYSLTDEGWQKLLGVTLVLLGVICIILLGDEDATPGAFLVMLGLARIVV